MRFLLALLLACPLWATVSVNPTSFSFTIPKGMAFVFPQSFAVSGGETWTRGTITGTCPSAVLTGSLTAFVTTGGDGTFFVGLSGTSVAARSVGSCTATIPIVGTNTVNLSVTITVSAASTPTLTNPSGTPDTSITGCSTPADSPYGRYFYSAECTVTNMRPGSTYTMPASPGTSANDLQMGGFFTRITPAGYAHAYSSLSAFNSNNNRILALHTSASSALQIYTTVGTLEFSGPMPDGGPFWDASDPNVYYYFTSNTIHKVTLGTAPAYSDVLWYTQAGATSISSGGSAGIGEDNWYAYKTDDAKVCIINLTTPTAYCASTALSPSLGTIDYPLASKGVDTTSGKRYVIVLAGNYSAIYSYIAGTLSFERNAPVNPSIQSVIPYFTDGAACTATIATAGAGYCLPTAHSDTVEVAGIQYWVYIYQVASPYTSTVSWFQLNAGDLMTTPTQAGGGATVVFMNNGGNTGYHIGCASKAGVCVIEPYSAALISSKLITGATNASPIVITSTSHGFSNGNSVLVGGVLGNTAANGVFTVAAATANTFELQGSTGNGTYTASTGAVTINATPVLDAGVGGLTVFTGVGATMNRLAMHRSVPFNNSYFSGSGYFDQPRASMSPDGAYVLFDSNGGVPDGGSVWMATISSAPPGSLRTLTRNVVSRGVLTR